MKGTVMLAIGFLIAACSSPSVRDSGGARVSRPSPKPGQDAVASASSRSVHIAGARSPGMLRLEFDAAGNWERIIARGSAALTDGVEVSAASVESAYTVAGLRAKQVLSEFLSSEVRTTRTVRRIARSYSEFPGNDTSDPTLNSQESARSAEAQDDDRASRSASNRQAERLAMTVVERIGEQSSAIVRGAQVTRREQADGGVLVELTASRESISAASEIARRMKGQM